VVFIVPAGVGVFVAKVGRFPYTIALLLMGLLISVSAGRSESTSRPASASHSLTISFF